MRVGTKNVSESYPGDTPEMIQICLHCDLPKCIIHCPKMLEAKGKTAPLKNRELNIMYPYKDGFITIVEASMQSGIKQTTLRCRIKKQGLTIEQAIEKGVPNRKKRKEK